MVITLSYHLNSILVLSMKSSLGFFLFSSAFYVSADVTLPPFEINDSTWREKVFSGNTQYQPMLGGSVLQAVSEESASGWVIAKRVDLLQTPMIHWRWKVDQALTRLDERSKQGDDYAARIYLVIEKGLMGLSSQALNYVWSSSQSEGTSWDNAYAGERVKMLAVKDNEAKLGLWHDEKRNVYQDFITYFGDKGSDIDNARAYQYIDVIAIMTDTDNSGEQAHAFYGEIRFTEQ